MARLKKRSIIHCNWTNPFYKKNFALSKLLWGEGKKGEQQRDRGGGERNRGREIDKYKGRFIKR